MTSGICHPGIAYPGGTYSDWVDAAGHAVTATYGIAQGVAKGVYTVTTGGRLITFGVLTPTPHCRALASASGGGAFFGNILILVVVLAACWGGYSLYRHYRPRKFPGRNTSRG